jgi:hypothetical protein
MLNTYITPPTFFNKMMTLCFYPSLIRFLLYWKTGRKKRVNAPNASFLSSSAATEAYIPIVGFSQEHFEF